MITKRSTAGLISLGLMAGVGFGSGRINTKHAERERQRKKCIDMFKRANEPADIIIAEVMSTNPNCQAAARIDAACYQTLNVQDCQVENGWHQHALNCEKVWQSKLDDVGLTYPTVDVAVKNCYEDYEETSQTYQEELPLTFFLGLFGTVLSVGTFAYAMSPNETVNSPEVADFPSTVEPSGNSESTFESNSESSIGSEFNV